MSHLHELYYCIKPSFGSAVIVLPTTSSEIGISLGIALSKPALWTIFRIPSHMKDAVKARIASLGEQIPHEDEEITWSTCLYEDEYALVTLEEAETSKNYLSAGPELNRALQTFLVPTPEGGYAWDAPTDNAQSWLVKADRLFVDAADRGFRHAVHEFGNHVVKLAEQAFSHHAKFVMKEGKLTVTGNDVMNPDPEYLVLGDVSHPTMTFNLEELDRPTSGIAGDLGRPVPEPAIEE